MSEKPKAEHPDIEEELYVCLTKISKLKLWLDALIKNASKYTTPTAVRRRKELEKFRTDLVDLLESWKFPIPDPLWHAAKIQQSKAERAAEALRAEVEAYIAWKQGKGKRPGQIVKTPAFRAELARQGWSE